VTLEWSNHYGKVAMCMKKKSVALVRERYQPSDSRLQAKLVSTFAERGRHVVSVTDPYVVFSDF
jgi:hypothetical protein